MKNKGINDPLVLNLENLEKRMNGLEARIKNLEGKLNEKY